MKKDWSNWDNWTPWTIRDHVPDGQNPSDKNDAQYRLIDLMCYLLRDYKYKDLFEDEIYDVVDCFTAKLMHPKHGHSFFTPGQQKDLVNEFRDKLKFGVIGKLQGLPRRVRIRDLYTGERQVVPAIRHTLERVQKKEPRFCMPFLGLRLTPQQCDAFLAKFGDYDLFELYTTPARDVQEAAATFQPKRVKGVVAQDADLQDAGGVALASNEGQEEEDTASSMEAFPSSVYVKPNDYCCSQGACHPQEEEFCSTVDGGGCSLGSTNC